MQWQEIIKVATQMRHWFHQHPELTWQEENTAERIRQVLTDWGIEWRACATFGTVGVIAPNIKQEGGKNIALRADMDALPIEETSEVEFASTVEGKMHACGHDGHMAALLGTALWLKQNESQLTNSVTLLFQPAEEGGHGALKMIEDGALEGVDEVYGWHNWPAMEFGTAVCPDGAVMSGNGAFEIQLEGIGGHASQPETCRDPLLAGAAISLNLQQIVSRRMPPQAATVVSVTQFETDSSATNVTPQTARLAGSLRFSEPQWYEPLAQLIEQIAEDTAKTYGVHAQVKIKPYYPATINHALPAGHFRKVLQNELGEGFSNVDMAVPIMASEDFSYYLRERPGAFALIGMADSEAQAYQYACHHPNYQFNDHLLELVMRSFCQIVGVDVPKKA
ncbi:N(2)-acetyl-L-2,4-diaminobutanoate deacetylase DoeB2 [Thiomicrorhabdus indica]|uniref:N(2)-acetyl-L-2,4-diaminobutanoate deacetylase DoeB2 n=1 Tax=Thiomicrorhabdus indica TaxID=2267253 RepID=UPI002AA6A82D|nr:N(2)-acetyl-L-2,4-diaminobutanoate deacetylase DoeB2 [Thiomicrorhabdus indica]